MQWQKLFVESDRGTVAPTQRAHLIGHQDVSKGAVKVTSEQRASIRSSVPSALLLLRPCPWDTECLWQLKRSTRQPGAIWPIGRDCIRYSCLNNTKSRYRDRWRWFFLLIVSSLCKECEGEQVDNKSVLCVIWRAKIIEMTFSLKVKATVSRARK